jgi:hypothetical protein
MVVFAMQGDYGSVHLLALWRSGICVALLSILRNGAQELA